MRVRVCRRRVFRAIDCEGVRYHTCVNERVAQIIDQQSREEPSLFMVGCVVELSKLLGGPEYFRDALRWLTAKERMGRRSTAIEVAVMHWAGQHDIGIG